MYHSRRRTASPLSRRALGGATKSISSTRPRGGQAGPARYGPVDWDPDSNRVTPCADPLAPLHSLAAIEEEIAAAIARRQARMEQDC